MRFFFYIIWFFLAPTLLAQNAKQLKMNNDLKEVVMEANMLFSYRIIEWWGSDLTEENKYLDNQVADYLIYHDRENLYFILLDETYKYKLGTYSLSITNADANIQFDATQQKLNRKERKLYRIKNKMELNASKLVNEKIIEKEGFSVSTVMIKQNNDYTLYLMANTSEMGIIPIGNDAVFHGNSRGRIKNWEWFHEELLPIPVSRDGVRLATHKHQEGQALISPTEIANFRLYGMLYDMVQMPILAIDKNVLLEYDAHDNTVHAFYPKD